MLSWINNESNTGGSWSTCVYINLFYRQSDTKKHQKRKLKTWWTAACVLLVTEADYSKHHFVWYYDTTFIGGYIRLNSFSIILRFKTLSNLLKWYFSLQRCLHAKIPDKVVALDVWTEEGCWIRASIAHSRIMYFIGTQTQKQQL